MKKTTLGIIVMFTVLSIMTQESSLVGVENYTFLLKNNIKFYVVTRVFKIGFDQ